MISNLKRKSNMSEKVLTTPEEIYQKIEDTYATEGGKKFIIHLIRSYFPIGKADYVWDKKDKPMVCCISGVGLVSKGDIWETMQNITPEEFSKDLMMKFELATEENPNPEPYKPVLVKKLDGRILGLETKESDKFMCKEAYQQLYNFYCNKVLCGDGHMNWVGKRMMVDSVVKNMKEEDRITPQEEKVVNKNANKPHKLTLGDLGVLQGLKEKMEKEEKK